MYTTNACSPEANAAPLQGCSLQIAHRYINLSGDYPLLACVAIVALNFDREF